MLLRNLNSGLADGVGEEDEDGHEDGEGDEGDAEDFLHEFAALDGRQALLFEEAATVFLVMVMMMGMFV